MALDQRLCVPETFAVEQRDAINARRVAQWSQATATSGVTRPLLLLIGELKEIVPARYGFRAVIKHVSDQPLAIDEGLYRRIGRRFGRELFNHLKPHSKRPRGIVCFLEKTRLVAVRDGIRLQQNGDPIDARNGVPEQFQPLADQLRGDEGKPRDIAARSRQTAD